MVILKALDPRASSLETGMTFNGPQSFGPSKMYPSGRAPCGSKAPWGPARWFELKRHPGAGSRLKNKNLCSFCLFWLLLLSLLCGQPVTTTRLIRGYPGCPLRPSGACGFSPRAVSRGARGALLGLSDGALALGAGGAAPDLKLGAGRPPGALLPRRQLGLGRYGAVKEVEAHGRAAGSPHLHGAPQGPALGAATAAAVAMTLTAW